MRPLPPPPLDEIVFPPDLFQPERASKPAADDGVVANARLTASLGTLLVIVLSAVGVTLLDVRGLIDWHAGLGLFAAGLVAVKLGSTGYRMVRYYRRDGRYVASGPPFIVLRLLAPFLVVTTAVLIPSGVAAMVWQDSIWLTVHKAAFWAWIGLAALHVLTYVWRLPRVVLAPRGANRRGRAAPALTAAVVALTVAGAVAAAWWGLAQLPPLADVRP